MSALANPKKVVFWRDTAFWIALSLGPLCWLVMFQLGMPSRQGAAPWNSLLWLALVYPILEEYLFRGGLQAALYRKTVLKLSLLGMSLANVVTSVVFAAMHLINQPPLWAMLVFGPSLVFGWMRDRHGNIKACTVLHITYNAGFIWFFQ